MPQQNEKYIKELQECRDKHLCYGCKKPLPKDYDKARCPKCLEYQRTHRHQMTHKVEKDIPVVPQISKQVEIEDKGQLIQHTVVVDENIEIGIKIPERLGYGEIMTLFDTVSRMVKPFMRQEQMFGEAPTQKVKKRFVILNDTEKKKYIEIWDSNTKLSRPTELISALPQLAGISYIGLTRRYYTYKSKL